MDIQILGRRGSSIYMRYIGNVILRHHHLSAALTAPTRLADHMEIDLENAWQVSFDGDF